MGLDDLQAQLDAIPDATDATQESGAATTGDASPAAATAYRVMPGDSLASIAAAHDTTPDALMAANVGTLITPDSLIIGQYIQLP